ncbi:Myb-like DNA-binding domain protein [Dissophora globulifera]|nr:Myb-like DNA-binding domain protein [Dissophora globulifera]
MNSGGGDDHHRYQGKDRQQEQGQEQLHEQLPLGINFDLDDLSDESDNDEVVDNDDDLAALLRSQNLPTISDRPTDSSMFVLDRLPTTGLAPTLPRQSSPELSSLKDAFGASQISTPVDVLSTLAQTQPTVDEWVGHDVNTASQLQHDGVPFLPTTADLVASSIPMDSSMASQADDDIQGIDNYDDDGDVTSSVDEDSDSDSAPLPYISLEERAELTSAIRQQSINALSINRIFQQAMQKQLQEIEQARARNKQFQSQLQDLIDRQEEAKRAPVLLRGTNARLGPPYFVDEDLKTPPDNEDAIRAKKRPVDITGQLRRWSERERRDLRDGVISENKRMLFEGFSEAGDLRAIASLAKVPDIQMMLNTKGLDWRRISQRHASVETRTPTECFIQWTGKDHPGINKAEWSNEEIYKLEELAEKYNERNWVQVALELDTNRTGAQCFQKYNLRIGKRVSKDSWTKQEDNTLTEAVRLMGEKNWVQIACCFENRTPAQCNYRWTKSLNPAIRRGHWLEEEDGALRAAFGVYGEARWVKIQQHVLGRTDVQCRERYVNVLSPGVKQGPWTDEENARLVELVEKHGRNWMLVVAQMGGRTDNQCARRYKAILIDQEKHRIQVKEDEAYAAFLNARQSEGRTKVPLTSQELVTHRNALKRVAIMERRKKMERRLLRKQRQEEEQLKIRMELERRSDDIRTMQEEDMQLEYAEFTANERRLYDQWSEHWGKYVDPVEKIFNIGIPPAIGPSHAEDGTDMDIDLTPIPSAVDPASTLLPGKIRPVPPCVATLTAFQRHLKQGEYLDGRFRLQHVISNGNVVANSLTTLPLSNEEQNQPEFIELAARMESVFMWPMLAGMLDMGRARELISVTQSLNPHPSKDAPPIITSDPAGSQSPTPVDRDTSQSSVPPTPTRVRKPSRKSSSTTKTKGAAVSSVPERRSQGSQKRRARANENVEANQQSQSQGQHPSSASSSSSSELDEPTSDVELSSGTETEEEEEEEELSSNRRSAKRARLSST